MMRKQKNEKCSRSSYRQNHIWLIGCGVKCVCFCHHYPLHNALQFCIRHKQIQRLLFFFTCPYLPMSWKFTFLFVLLFQFQFQFHSLYLFIAVLTNQKCFRGVECEQTIYFILAIFCNGLVRSYLFFSTPILLFMQAENIYFVFD